MGVATELINVDGGGRARPRREHDDGAGGRGHVDRLEDRGAARARGRARLVALLRALRLGVLALALAVLAAQALAERHVRDERA